MSTKSKFDAIWQIPPSLTTDLHRLYSLLRRVPPIRRCSKSILSGERNFREGARSSFFAVSLGACPRTHVLRHRPKLCDLTTWLSHERKCSSAAITVRKFCKKKGGDGQESGVMGGDQCFLFWFLKYVEFFLNQIYNERVFVYCYAPWPAAGGNFYYVSVCFHIFACFWSDFRDSGEKKNPELQKIPHTSDFSRSEYVEFFKKIHIYYMWK